MIGQATVCRITVTRAVATVTRAVATVERGSVHSRKRKCPQ